MCPSIEDIDSRVSSPSILNDSQIDNQPALSTTPTKNAGELTISRPSLLNEDDTELSTSSTIMDNETSSVFHFGSKDIMPFPKTTKTKRANVKRGKTAIITSSPYRLEVEASQNKQAEKIKKALIFQKA